MTWLVLRFRPLVFRFISQVPFVSCTFHLRHQIDRTSKINFCATTQKHLGNFEEKNRRLYFSNGPSGPARGTETIKKRITITLHVSKMGEKTRH